MTEEEKEFLCKLELQLFTRLHNEATKYYEEREFIPRYAGDTFFDAYIDMYGKEQYEEWQKLQNFNVKYCYE